MIDATAFCYRAFYALRGLSTSFGQPTNAIFGFVNMLNKILKEKKPAYLAVCFDVSRDTFRQKEFSAYKSQRPPVPEELESQFPFIKRIVSAYGIALFEKEGFEADDVIATLVKRARESGVASVIVSSDKDILQLVDDTTRVLNPSKEEGMVYDPGKVAERFGVDPGRIPDIIALMGDQADNIPGVPGIGEKTARELIAHFGSAEQVLENLGKVKQEKIRRALAEHRERVVLNKKLALLNGEVPIEFDLEKLKVGSADTGELFRIYKHLEFKKFLSGLALPGEEAEEPALEPLSAEAREALLRQEGELFLYGAALEDLVGSTGGRTFSFARDEGARALLGDPRIKKTGHDLKKLRVRLAQGGITLEGMHFDTMIAAYLLNPSKSEYRLSDLAWDYLGVSAGKVLSGGRAVDLVRQLEPRLREELEKHSLLGLFADLEMPLVEVLSCMELNGITLDTEALNGLSQDIEKRLITLIRDIYELSGTQFNINSTKQLRDVLFERLRLPVVKRSKTGPSTDEEVLKALSVRHRLPALLLEYRQLVKLKNTYVDTLPGLIDPRTGKVHTSFNQAATETGRLSSSNPNLQNLPVKTEIGKRIRQAVVSSGEGRVLVSCDYSQIELRVLAHLSGDEELVAAFRQGRDVHRLTASLIYGLPEQDVTDEMREMAKRVNFGIVYGLTAFGLSRDLGITLEEAQQFIDAYFARYPGVKEYIGEQIRKARADGFVTTLLGRRRYLPQINDKSVGVRQFAERQAVNTPIQGSASDLIKLAMIDIHRLIREKALEGRMILQIHDELLFDVPQGELDDLARMVRDRMERVLELRVPVKVDVKKGKNWLDMEPLA